MSRPTKQPLLKPGQRCRMVEGGPVVTITRVKTRPVLFERGGGRVMIGACCKPRPIRRSRFGLSEDPTGQIVVANGRLYEVTGTYRRESPANIMLKTRHFDGSEGPDVASGSARILPGHYHEEESCERS